MYIYILAKSVWLFEELAKKHLLVSLVNFLSLGESLINVGPHGCGAKVALMRALCPNHYTTLP